MGLICDRCSEPVYYREKCEYCNKFVCTSCVKSGKRVKKIRRYVICRDCWGNTRVRSKFKAL